MKHVRKALTSLRVRWLLFIALLAALSYVKLPYTITQPGTVEPIAPRITVENGHKSEKGTFNLTTVASYPDANPYLLAYGLVASHTQIEKSSEARGNLSAAEYDRLLRHMMNGSQNTAIVSALHAAGENIQIHDNGVFVRWIYEGSKAVGVLEVGDIIKSVDGHPVNNAAEFSGYLAANKKLGDKIEVEVTRDGQTSKKQLELIQLADNPPKIGIGIMPEDEMTVDTPRSIKIEASDIGGPSAGLMFSLEIYNQIASDDLTRGYRIAGTGTIDRDGVVGQIGGIKDKIVAAHRAKVDYFFCPKDVNPGDANEKDIKDEAQKEGYNIQIIPVHTLQDAIDFLKKLPPKS